VNLQAFDVETRGTEMGYGLQPFRVRTGEAWLTMCAMVDAQDEVSLMKPTVATLRRWLKECAENGVTIVGWNTPFDMAWLIAMGLREEVFACKWLDAMLLWKHLTSTPEWTGLAPKSYGLKHAVALHYPDEAGYEKDINFETDDPSELTSLAEYNVKDAAFTLRLAQHFLQRLNKAQKRNALIEAACLPMVAEAYVEGIVMDHSAAQDLAKKLTDDANVAMVTLKVTTQDDVDETTLASPKKLRKLLFEDWGLPVVKETKKGADSTDRDALSQLALIDPRAGLLNDFREAKGNRTKFAEGTIKSLDYNGDGCARPNAKVFGTYTGRMTYGSSILRGKDQKPTGVALHQWKRDPAFRRLIKAPEGYTLMEFDFAGQEFRWMAVMSGDQTMLEKCQPGEDAHSYMGGKIANISYKDMLQGIAEGDPKMKAMRQLGKVANLGLGYRTSAKTLHNVARVQHKLDISEIESKAIWSTYRTTYPGVLEYWNTQTKNARLDGWVETIAGRRVHLGEGSAWKKTLAVSDILSTTLDNTWASESTAINFPIQGSGADQKYLALAVLKDYLKQVDGKFYFELHDGLFVIIPDHHAEKALHQIKYLLSNLPYKKAWGVDLPVMFPVDAKHGKTWGDLKELK
jgi:DNA polymerase-1